VLAVGERRREVEFRAHTSRIHARSIAARGRDRIADPGSGGEPVDTRPDHGSRNVDDEDCLDARGDARGGARARSRGHGRVNQDGPPAACARGQDRCADDEEDDRPDTGEQGTARDCRRWRVWPRGS